MPGEHRVPQRRLAPLAVALAASAWAGGAAACARTARAVQPRAVRPAQPRAVPAAGRGARAADAERLAAEGAAAFERGDVATARDTLGKALALDPANVAAHTCLGIIADQSGDAREAERHFSAAARAAPALASARNNYGAVLMRSGRNAAAAAEFEASLRLDPDQPNALVNLAQIRFAAGTPEDLRAAASLFARAHARAPDPQIARALVVVSLRLGDRAAASARYRDYAASLSAAPAPVASRSELGAALLEAGLFAEAESELAAASALDPADAETVVRLARARLGRRDVAGAGRALEAAVARGVDPAPVYALLAEVYQQSGHVENAIPAMRLAIQRDPASEKYRFSYGLLLTDAYAPAAAVIRLEEALKTFPESPRLWFALGLAHFKLDKDEEASRAFRRALSLDPKFAPPSAYLGMMRAKAGDYAGAVALYEQALAADPRLAAAHHLIADALLKRPDAEEARVESHLKKAVELDATFTPARLALGRLYVRGERWAEAAAELERVAALDPEAAEAYYHLGRAYARLKRAADSQAALATYRRLSETQKAQGDAEVREIVKRLAGVRF